MERLIKDYMRNDTLRHELNVLTQKEFRNRGYAGKLIKQILEDVLA